MGGLDYIGTGARDIDIYFPALSRNHVFAPGSKFVLLH